MKAVGNTVEEILSNVPEDRSEPFKRLHQVIVENLPTGFVSDISYGGLGYVVPHSIYPNGYHCKPTEPLPFAGIASQKNTINFYHMGIYCDTNLLDWFKEEFPKYSKQKLDMGKSCVRFKKFDDIPFDLIGKLMQKITVEKWIEIYEANFKLGKSKK
jgi:hypothetical protein